MPILITDEMLKEFQLSESDFQLEFAVFLFQQCKISIGKASQLANCSRLQFQKILYSRQIPIHYDVEDFQQDLELIYNS